MKKKILITLILLTTIFLVTGCSLNFKTKTGGNQQPTTTIKRPGHKIYRYMKISSESGTNLLYNASRLFGETYRAYQGEDYYDPCLIVEFNNSDGKAKKATFYTFFQYDNNDEYVDEAMSKFEEASKESKKAYSNVKKEHMTEDITYISADINVNSYEFTQFIDTYLIKGQDIEKYKDEVYFSRLYNYESTPPVEVGDNYFYESLEGIRIEWSDNKIEALEK